MVLRRNRSDKREVKVTEELTTLIRTYKVVLIGPIRQELLSGISNPTVFEDLKNKMSVFLDYPIQTSDYEQAAEYFNVCRRNGIQGSHIDFLICAVAVKNGWDIFSEDKDFKKYQEYLPINLYECAL
jgi:predicted nucleic acid-binding protein